VHALRLNLVLSEAQNCLGHAGSGSLL